jgi:diguanylate cyclase (GGDEF)-like protein
LGLALLFGAAAPLVAEHRPLAFERLSLEQGLSQTSVLCVFQDRQGYMWFGTEDGLNRYDGYAFKTYKYDPFDAGSLPNNMVWAIVEDRSGDLWLATEGGGVARWDRATDRFVRFGQTSTELSSRTRTILAAPDGALWIGTKDAGLARLDPASGVLKRYVQDPNDPGSLSHNAVYALLFDRSGRLWVGTDGGLNRLDPATSRFERFLHDTSRPESLSDDRIRSLFEDRAGRLWIGTYGGLNRLEPNGDRFQQYRHDPANASSLSHDRVRAIFEDNTGRLWVGTDGGLDLMDRQRSAFARYRHDPTDLAGLGDGNVMSLYQDRGGLLWVGTRSAGVHKWNPATWSFGHRTKLASEPNGLSEKSVTSFTEDRGGRVWIGTLGGGLHTMDRLTGELSRYTGKAAAGLGDRVMALASDAEGSLWIGTMDQGLGRLNPTTHELRRFRHDASDPKSLGADAVMALGVDSVGDLWVGTYGAGLNRYDASTGAFSRYRHDPAKPTSISADIVTSLAEDPSGALWLGTDGGGLNRFDRRSGEFRHFKHDPNDPKSLGSDTVFSLRVDAAGRLWVGTRGAGLALLEARSGASTSFRHFTQREGLANDVVYGILPDGDGNLWLSTNNGLSRFDPRAERFKNYDASHGLQSNEFNFGAHYRSASGELFFGGVNGFNAFSPQRLVTNTNVPPVVLTSFLKLNRPAKTARPLSQLDRIDLGHRDDVVTFEFAALDYAAPQRNRYAYRLEGFDPEWIEQGGVRRVTYTNLEPGSYRFRVRASNNDGVWNEAGLNLGLSVEAPPWRRWWAYVGYVLLLGVSLLGFVRVQQRRLAREAEYSRRLEHEVEERTVELAARNADLEQTNKKLAEASLTDSLTGLRNRRFLFEHVSKDADLVRRRYLALKQGTPARTFDLSFMMIDLDHFKLVNDSCGHAAGDEVLRGVREVLEKSARNSDILIRWGGDEFLLVGRDNDAETLGALAERIRAQVEATTFEVGEGRVARTTCSIGYACYPFVRSEPNLYPWEDVLRLADLALYEAKRSRNAWVGFVSTQQPPASEVAPAAHLDPSRLIEAGVLHVLSGNDRSEGGAVGAGSQPEAVLSATEATGSSL